MHSKSLLNGDIIIQQSFGHWSNFCE